MGFFGKLIRTTTIGGAATVGAFFYLTRNSKFVPLSTTDALFNSTFYTKYNPRNNPTTHDICVKKVPLSKIKPELLKDGKLAEAFCAGVWGGKGYAFQRWYLARKYEGPTTAHQLWSTQQLLSSTYDVGTQITDHFEVLEKTADRIVVRCGDSPLKTEVRDSDGLFEMGAKVNEQEGVAEFHLKSIFYKGLGKSEGEPMPPHIAWLHRQYAKLWLETAVTNCTK